MKNTVGWMTSHMMPIDYYRTILFSKNNFRHGSCFLYCMISFSGFCILFNVPGSWVVFFVCSFEHLGKTEPDRTQCKIKNFAKLCQLLLFCCLELVRPC